MSSLPFGKLRVGILPAGSDARRTAQLTADDADDGDFEEWNGKPYRGLTRIHGKPGQVIADQEEFGSWATLHPVLSAIA